MGGRGGSSVGVAVVAPGTSSYVGRMLGNRGVEGGTVFSSSKIKPKNRVLLYTYMFARAFGIFCFFCFSPADAAAAAATALLTAGSSCSVIYFFLTILRKLYGGGCCTEPSEKYSVRI